MGADSWLILRCSGRHTMSLAASLAEDGFEVWTPVETRLIRKPRWNVKREVRLPMLASFVFARSHHLFDLLEMERMPVKPRRGIGCQKAAHPSFRVFRHLDRLAFVADRSLEQLRLEEEKAVPRKAQAKFNRGDHVRVKTGAFEGLVGRVERCRSGHALVIFNGSMRPVQMPTFLLREDEAYGLQSREGTAARKAA